MRPEPRVVVRAGAEGTEAGGLAQLLAQHVELGAVEGFQRGTAHADARARGRTTLGEGRERLLGGEGRHSPRLAALVQGRQVRGEAAATLHQRGHGGLDVRPGDAPGALEGEGDVAGDPAAVAGAVVQVEHEVVEADGRQAREHGVDRGALLGHEQRAPTGRRQAGDEVGDRLRLAGAGRSLDDEVRAGEHGVDHGLLRGVGVEHEVLGRGVGVAGRCGSGDVGDGRDGLGVTGQRRDDVVLGERVALGLQVGHHRQPRVGERADDQAVLHREAGHVTAGLGDPLQHGTRVEAVVVQGEVGDDVGVEPDAVLAGQVVHQHGVELGGWAEVDVEVVAGGASRTQRARAQQHGRRRGAGGVRRVPGGHADGQPAGLDAALLGQLRRSWPGSRGLGAGRRRGVPASRTSVDRRVGRPASSMASPLGCACVRSSVPTARSR